MGIIEQDGIYHYTNRAAAFSILKDGQLRLSHISGFNDYFDSKPKFFISLKEDEWDMFVGKVIRYVNRYKSFKYDYEDIRKRRETVSKIRTDIELFIKDIEVSTPWGIYNGVLCLAQNANMTSQWYHYAEKHQGVVLSFNKIGDFSGLIPMKYGKDIMPLNTDNLLKLLTDDHDFLTELYVEIFTCKADDWSSEKELRLVRTMFIPSPIMGAPPTFKNYIEVTPQNLNKVFLGPRVNITPVKDKNGEIISTSPEADLIKIIKEKYFQVEVYKIIDSDPGFKLKIEKVFP